MNKKTTRKSKPTKSQPDDELKVTRLSADFLNRYNTDALFRKKFATNPAEALKMVFPELKTVSDTRINNVLSSEAARLSIAHSMSEQDVAAIFGLVKAAVKAVTKVAKTEKVQSYAKEAAKFVSYEAASQAVSYLVSTEVAEPNPE